MTDFPIDQLVAEGWLYAALRLSFIAAIYLFLFAVFRATVRELRVAAQEMSGEGRAARAALVVLDPAESSLATGASLPLEPITLLGRALESTIVVDDPHVSARHAELRFARGQWWLRDLGSSNGTTLNGHPVRTVMGVRPGDALQCGRVRFRLVPLVPVHADPVSA
jgi:hypothetical protein